MDFVLDGAETEHYVNACAILSPAPPPFVQIIPFSDPLEGDVWLSATRQWRFQLARNWQYFSEVWIEIGQPTLERHRIVGEWEEAIQARCL
jgi:hypothetical protein